MNLSLAAARQLLLTFAEQEAADFSPLYHHLAVQSADDDQVSAFLTVPLLVEPEASSALLFAAAHRLVQAEPLHPLSRYYPSLGGFDGVDSETWPLFRAFVLERTEKMHKLLSSQRISNNDVRHAAALYPGVSLAAQAAGEEVALLEIGCSAGLLLGLDQFGYRYQRVGAEQLVLGPAKAAVGLHCALDLAPSAVLPKLAKKTRIAARWGLDEYPIDVADEEQLAWLESCVWADQPDQVRLLRAAANAQRKIAPSLVAGDPVRDLMSVATQIPVGQPLVLVTNQVLTGWRRSRQEEFLEQVKHLASQRARQRSALWWVSLEGAKERFPDLLPGLHSPSGKESSGEAADPSLLLALTRWTEGVPHVQSLASTTARKQRLTWLA